MHFYLKRHLKEITNRECILTSTLRTEDKHVISSEYKLKLMNSLIKNSNLYTILFICMAQRFFSPKKISHKTLILTKNVI